MKKLLLMMAIFVFAAMPATAANWYVDAARGDDAMAPALVHAGFAQAFRTIGQAVAAAADSDVIYINSGTYPEFVQVNKSLSFIGVGNVIIDGNMRLRYGMRFYNVMASELRNIIFQNCYIGVYAYNTVGNNVLTVNDCTFRNNDYGFYGSSNLMATVRNSVFYDNYQYGYYAGGSTSTKHVVSYCTFDGNWGGFGWLASSPAELYFTNSVLTNNSRALEFYYIAPTRVVNCDFYGNSSNLYPYFPTGPNFGPFYYVDPGYINRAGKNFQLSATSPLLELQDKDQEGLRIAYLGALRAGAVSSTAYDNWAGWVDDQGAPVATSAKVRMLANGISLQSGITGATVLSPVYDSGNPAAKLVRVQYRASEYEREAPGSKSYIDYDLSTSEQEIRYRVGNNAGALGAWQTTLSNAPLSVTARYYQVELVLRNQQ